MTKALKFPDKYGVVTYCATCNQIRCAVDIKEVDVQVLAGCRPPLYAPLLRLLLDCGHTHQSLIWDQAGRIMKYSNREAAYNAAKRVAREILEHNKE